MTLGFKGPFLGLKLKEGWVMEKMRSNSRTTSSRVAGVAALPSLMELGLLILFTATTAF